MGIYRNYSFGDYYFGCLKHPNSQIDLPAIEKLMVGDTGLRLENIGPLGDPPPHHNRMVDIARASNQGVYLLMLEIAPLVLPELSLPLLQNSPSSVLVPAFFAHYRIHTTAIFSPEGVLTVKTTGKQQADGVSAPFFVATRMEYDGMREAPFPTELQIRFPFENSVESEVGRVTSFRQFNNTIQKKSPHGLRGFTLVCDFAKV